MRARGDMRPIKSLGQNFLADMSIASRVAREAGLDKSVGVLEVGPGEGALTDELRQAAGHVVAVELDGRLIPGLESRFAGAGNVEILRGDILKTDIRRVADERLRYPRRAACANLPYGITTPAISALLGAETFESVTVMVQREVAARICAAPGTPECGAFSIFCQFYAECETLFDVPPEAFRPRPKVWSSVVRLVARRERAVQREGERAFFRVTRAAFAQRRKTLANALHASFGETLSKDEIAGALTALGYDPRLRGETLGIADFAAVASALSELTGRVDKGSVAPAGAFVGGVGGEEVVHGEVDFGE